METWMTVERIGAGRAASQCAAAAPGAWAASMRRPVTGVLDVPQRLGPVNFDMALQS
jgi:hypothetical protein